MLSRQYLRLLLGAGVCAATALAASPAPDSADFFESRIRPVLANNCYSCHAASQLGGLRVDSRDAILKGGKSGPAMIAGDPDKSLLIQAVRQTNPKLKMPMGGKLKDQEIEDLTAWVKAGANWPVSGAPVVAPVVSPKTGEYVITPEQRSFWSFQPLKKPVTPAPADAGWAKTDFDRFVLAKLEREGLKPVKTADKRTLIRRATLDLTGLPATFEDIEAFEKDQTPEAFAKVVDRLLASPQYGERWGRFWLDVARYGEDDYRSLDPMRRGYNPYPGAYLYRDWVIRAFNDDIPYDTFVKAQLAADLMEEKSRAKLLPALGFLGQGPWFYDNGSVEVTRADERHDRVDVVSRGFLGLTVGCARCHNHKYDPIPTKDYYGLAGVFLNTVYHEYPLVPKSVHEEYKKHEKEIEAREDLLDDFMSTESKQLGETLAFQAAKYMQSAWKVTGPDKAELAMVVQQDKLDFELFERWIKFLAKPPKNYPYLVPWQEMIKRGGSTKDEAKKLAEEFQKTLLGIMFERHEIKDENEIIANKALPTTKKKKPANLPNEFVTNDDFCPGCGLELKTLPIEKMNLWVDVFSHDLNDGDDPLQAPEKIKPGLLSFRGWSLERQLSAERRAYIDALRADMEAMKKAQPPHFPYVHGVMEAEKLQEQKLNLRGSPFNLGEDVPRHFLSILSNDPIPLSHGSGRLDLAEQIVKQPIAMRVIVNRVWRAHMGTGVVDSPSNFGITGERPTNPELLEYMAQWFVDNGMSMKKLHREILLSSVYQLSDEGLKDNLEKDPANRMYWRANRHRMDAEQIRDAILFVAGDLDAKIGGPSEPLKPDYTRRTVYGKVSRFRLDEYLQLFDFPSPNLSAEKRFATTVPLQRLFFMNSEFVQQQAEHLAQRVASEPDNTARIQKIYKLVYGRAATPEEVTLGIEYLRTEPMKAYEEIKAKEKAEKEKAEKEKAEKEKADKDKSAKDKKGLEMAKAPEPKPAVAAAPAAEVSGAGQTPDDDSMDEGMMAGVMAPGKAKPEEKKPPLPVTTWGRYAKVLLSSSEFLFVN